MDQGKFKLSPKDFGITPGGEVVIDNYRLLEALKAVQTEDFTRDSGQNDIVVTIGVGT
jgi:hypothetical protein